LADPLGAFLDAVAALGDKFVAGLTRVALAVRTALVGVGDVLATRRAVGSNVLASPLQSCCGRDVD
jgi:hypothetical protein